MALQKSVSAITLGHDRCMTLFLNENEFAFLGQAYFFWIQKTYFLSFDKNKQKPFIFDGVLLVKVLL